MTWLDQRRAAVVASTAQEAATDDDRDHASAAIPPDTPHSPSAARIRGQPPFPIPEVVMNPIHTIRRLASILAGLAATTLAFAAAPPAALATPAPPDPGPAGVVPPPAIQTVVTVGMPGWQITLIAAGAALLAATLAVLLDRARAARRHMTAPTT